MKGVFSYLTPEGFDNLLLRFDGETLTGLWFEGSRDERKHPSAGEQCPPAALRGVYRWLDIYFSGRQPDFTPQYRLDNLTPFRKEVLERVCQIPFGQTVTYGELAAEIARSHNRTDGQQQHPMAARAVGGAVGWNPICLIIPCHRVVGVGGSLTGYGGGLHNKRALLRLEEHDRLGTIPL